MGAVKEQSANLYATKMAEQGFVTCHWTCPSGVTATGKPRNAVAPDIYAEDFSAAVDYLRTQSFVDRERIGALGICGSGSFVISAAKIDPRMKAIATVSMYDMGAANRDASAATASTLEQRKPSPRSRRPTSATPNSAAAQTAYTVARPNELTDESSADRAGVLRLLPHLARRIHAEGVDGAHDAPDADQQREIHELLPVQRHRDDLAAAACCSSPATRRTRASSARTPTALAAEPKELVIVPGAGHVDLYDRVEPDPLRQADRLLPEQSAKQVTRFSPQPRTTATINRAHDQECERCRHLTPLTTR